MKIIIPMAGRGSRFADRGVSTPKPLIEVFGKPMIYWALESLKNINASEYIFIALREHEEKYNLIHLLKSIIDHPLKLVLLDDVTEGQLCTVLAAKIFINTDEDILIAASDTKIDSNIADHIQSKSKNCKGIISVINLPGDRWSFAKTDENGRVIEVAEKVRISDYASTGLYYFSNGKEFISESEKIIRNQEKTKGEYYIIPVYQKFIINGELITISEANQMWDMGTPEAKQQFENFLEINSLKKK